MCVKVPLISWHSIYQSIYYSCHFQRSLKATGCLFSPALVYSYFLFTRLLVFSTLSWPYLLSTRVHSFPRSIFHGFLKKLGCLFCLIVISSQRIYAKVFSVQNHSIYGYCYYITHCNCDRVSFVSYKTNSDWVIDADFNEDCCCLLLLKTSFCFRNHYLIIVYTALYFDHHSCLR